MEYETVRLGNVADNAEKYLQKFRAVDALVLDELESMFICMYAANINGW